MHIKRTLAYIIDAVFITCLLLLLLYFIPISNKQKETQTKIDEIGEEYALQNMSKMDYFMELSKLEKKLDKEKAIEIVIDSLLIVIYFIIIPFIIKGYTLGRKIMGIKIVDNNMENVSLMSLFIRCFLMDGLLASLLIILGIYLVPNSFYLSYVSILAILQFLTLIISFFMIKYSSNSLGLEDKLSHSKVILVD